MPVDNTETISRLEQALYEAREALDDFRRAQNDDSDEANEDAIYSAGAALDSFEGAIGSMVP